jgi:hypothetical protein
LAFRKERKMSACAKTTNEEDDPFLAELRREYQEHECCSCHELNEAEDPFLIALTEAVQDDDQNKAPYRLPQPLLKEPVEITLRIPADRAKPLIKLADELSDNATVKNYRGRMYAEDLIIVAIEYLIINQRKLSGASNFYEIRESLGL